MAANIFTININRFKQPVSMHTPLHWAARSRLIAQTLWQLGACVRSGPGPGAGSRGAVGKPPPAPLRK